MPATLTACAATSSRPSRWPPRAAGPPRGARPWLAWRSRRRGSSGGPSDGRRRGGAPDPALVELVERSAAQVKELLPLLPGHAPWGAQADAALSTVALARGDIAAAAWPAARPSQALQAALHEDASLEIVIPAARAVLAGAPPEMQGSVRAFLQPTLSQDRPGHGRRDDPRPLAHRARSGASSSSWPARWTRPAGAGWPRPAGRRRPAGPSLDDADRRLLQLLTEGRTNAEIATELDLAEDDVAQRLARLLARLGTSSRAEATSLAFRGLAAVGSR